MFALWSLDVCRLIYSGARLHRFTLPHLEVGTLHIAVLQLQRTKLINVFDTRAIGRTSFYALRHWAFAVYRRLKRLWVASCESEQRAVFGDVTRPLHSHFSVEVYNMWFSVIQNFIFISHHYAIAFELMSHTLFILLLLLMYIVFNNLLYFGIIICSVFLLVTPLARVK